MGRRFNEHPRPHRSCTQPAMAAFVQLADDPLLPDMLAISDPEVQLPTLTMNSDQLAGITSTSSEAPFSLSGIIKEFGMNIPDQPDQPDQHQQQSTISVPAGTVP